MAEDTEYLKLSVEDRCQHKLWKARVSGYEDAAKLFAAATDPKSPELQKFAPLIKNFVADSNAAAQEKGLAAVLAFVENAQFATRDAEPTEEEGRGYNWNRQEHSCLEHEVCCLLHLKACCRRFLWKGQQAVHEVKRHLRAAVWETLHATSKWSNAVAASFRMESMAGCMGVSVLQGFPELPTIIWIAFSFCGFWIFFRHESARKKKTDHALGARTKRPKRPMPPVFPNGWIPVLETSQLGRGDVKPLDVMGESLVAFRTSDGTAHVTDAHCPHLGAHFGVGGRVTGNCIECPFHGWKFDLADGTCRNVPYSTSVPSFVQLRTWKTSERLGAIFIWYHADGEDPSWEIPDVPEITRDGWAMRSRSSYLVRCHIQDIVENEADLGHFGHLHGPPILLPEGNCKSYGTTSNRRFAEYRWDVSWTSNGHIGVLDIRAGLSVLGYCPSLLQFRVSLQQVGPAFVVARIRSKFGEAVLLHSSTPEAPFRLRLVHRLFTGAGLGRLAAWYIAWFTKEMRAIG